MKHSTLKKAGGELLVVCMCGAMVVGAAMPPMPGAKAISPKVAGSADRLNKAMVSSAVVGPTNTPLTNIWVNFTAQSNCYFFVYSTTNLTASTGTLPSLAITNLPWANWQYYKSYLNGTNTNVTISLPVNIASQPSLFYKIVGATLQ